MLPQSDYNVIASGTNGYTAGAGYNLVTGLGTPVANLLVPDLVAYQGAGTTYAGPTVGPLKNADLVNTGTTDSGPIDVFSVFDALTVRNNGFGYAQDPSRGGELNARVVNSQNPGEASQRAATQDLNIPSPMTAVSGSSMMPLDNTAVLDAVLIGWSAPGTSVARRSPVQESATVDPSVSVQTSLISGGPRTPVLDAGSVDAVLGDAGMPHSLLESDGNLVTVKRMLSSAGLAERITQ